MNRTWAAWLTLVVLIGVGTHVVAWLALHAVPDLARRLHAGQAPPAAPTRSAHAPALASGPPRPATVGAAVCGRCRAVVPSIDFASACPWCGGVAVRTQVAPPAQPAGRPRKRAWRAAPIGAGRRVA